MSKRQKWAQAPKRFDRHTTISVDALNIPDVFVPLESPDIAVLEFVNADSELVRVAMSVNQAKFLTRQLVSLIGITSRSE